VESPTIELFTAPDGLAAAYPPGTPGLPVSFAAVLLTWPDPSYALSVDPGGPLALRLGGAPLADLIGLVRRLVVELGDGDITAQ
jgi:hypothetical protein